MAEGFDRELYRPDMLEKVIRLASILELASDHPVLGGNLALEGGTALNLFILEPDRLSLDLDLNYIASDGLEQMLEDQPKCVEAVCGVARELGFRPEHSGVKHAGCTIKLFYQSESTGLNDFVKVDLDFVNRVPLMKPEMRSMTVPDIETEFLVSAPVEVVAGKVRAALSRTVPRDLYDLIRISENRAAWSTGDEVLDHHVIYYNALLSNRFPNHGPLYDEGRYRGREDAFEQILRPVLPADSALTYEELLDRSLPVLKEFAEPIDDAERTYAYGLANGRLDASELFAGYKPIAENANKNPAAEYKRRNIEKAIDEGIIERKHVFAPGPERKRAARPDWDERAMRELSGARAVDAGRGAVQRKPADGGPPGTALK